MSYASERKILTPVLRKVANRDVRSLNNRDFSAAEQVLARWGRKPKKLDPRLHKKLIEQKTQRASSRASHNQETDAIYKAVERRANGCCESVGFHGGGGWFHDGPLEWDHWLHGNGRRRQRQSVETTWMLCRNCHRARQENSPSAAYWNAIFERHCTKYEYPFEAHITHADLPKRATP